MGRREGEARRVAGDACVSAHQAGQSNACLAPTPQLDSLLPAGPTPPVCNQPASRGVAQRWCAAQHQHAGAHKHKLHGGHAAGPCKGSKP